MEVERDHVLDKPKKDGRGGPVRRVREGDGRGEQGAGRGHRRAGAVLPSRRWSPRRSSTGCSTTAPSSACRRTRAARRSRTTSASPGCWSPTRCRCCCRSGRPGRSRTAARSRTTEADLLELPAERRPVVSHKELLELRKQLNTMVGAYVHQSGKPHGVIHTELRRVCGGPPSAEATAGQLRRADQEGAGVGHADAVSPRRGPCGAVCRSRRAALVVPASAPVLPRRAVPVATRPVTPGWRSAPNATAV